jgi:hypothetical protein
MLKGNSSKEFPEAVKKLCFLTGMPGIFLLQKRIGRFLQRPENPERSGLRPRMSICGQEPPSAVAFETLAAARSLATELKLGDFGLLITPQRTFLTV